MKNKRKPRDTVFYKLTWDKTDEGFIIRERVDGDDKEKVVLSWDKRMRESTTLKTLARNSIKNDFTMMVTYMIEDEEGRRFGLGPTGSAYKQFVAQGTIIEPKAPEPFVK